jgi:V/A-type H+-transporting ATPase subunit I
VSIVPLRKATLFGRLDDKPSALKALQDLGALHVVSLRPKAARAEVELPPGAQRALRALQYLAAVPERRKQLHHDPAFDVEALIRQVEANREALRDYRDRIDFLRARIAKLEPWGDFRLPPLSDLAGVRLWFYVVPHRYEAALEHLELPWQVAHRGNRENWVVVLSRDEPPADLLPVPRTHTGAKPLSTLRLELEQAEVEMEALLSERQALTRFLYLLGQNLARAEDRAAFTAAAGQTLDGEATFVLQGWVPEERRLRNPCPRCSTTRRLLPPART